MVSVIVPVYQVKNYLEQCVNSILAQTYRNFEVILVDDGSTDGSGRICDAFALFDARVRVIHKKNEGLAAARNTGMQMAKGCYLMFIDSDDHISSMMMERMRAIMEEEQADLVVCGFQKYIEQVPGEELDVYDCGGYTGREILNTKKNQKNYGLWTSSCNKMYRREIMSQLSYAEGKVCEDEYMTVPLYLACEKVVAIPDILYFYRCRPNSIMTSWTVDKQLDRLDAMWINAQRYLDEGLDAREAYKQLVYGLEYYLECRKNELTEEQRVSMQRILREERRLIRRLRRQSIAWWEKLSLFGIRFLPRTCFRVGICFRTTLEKWM